MGYKSVVRSLIAVSNQAAKEKEREYKRQIKELERLQKKYDKANECLDKIKNNAEKIVIFASKDDPYIPISEPVLIKEKTDAEYHESNDEGHFGEDVSKKEFSEIITVVSKYIQCQKIKP